MKTKKRLLSVLLSLVLVLGLMPGMSLTAYAAVGDIVPEADSLTFTAEENGSSVTLNYFAGTVECKKGDEPWKSYTKNESISLNENEFVRFRGTGTTFNYSNHVSIGGKVACSGNVMSLRLKSLDPNDSSDYQRDAGLEASIAGFKYLY